MTGANTRDGGKPVPRDVMNYQPPTGRGGSTSGPGLGGENTGTNNNTIPVRHDSGSPGVGGENFGTCGTQGKY